MKKLFFLLILLAAATACFGNVSEDRLRKFENYMEFVMEKYKREGTNKASFSGFAIIKHKITRLTGLK